jgi:hypothetical protein
MEIDAGASLATPNKKRVNFPGKKHFPGIADANR